MRKSPREPQPRSFPAGLGQDSSPDFSQLPEIGHEAARLGFWTARSDASGGLDAGDDVRVAPNRPGRHTTPDGPVPPAVVNVCRRLANRQAGPGGARKR